LANVVETASVSCQEVFGPVVTLTPFTALDEAISAVNRSRFGLQAGIYTNDISAALRAAEDLEVGGVMINDIPTFRVDNMPYGGLKDSGVGREGVKYAVEEMTELKLICIKL
jgi:acyl-CoA reductase-like NAD-dependent aldehyde dehydrogenase